MAGTTERDLIVGVIQLANLLTRRLAPVFEKSKITPQQWAVLSVLGESDAPMTLAGLARKLLVSKQNMTGMVDRLLQLGLIERSSDPTDARAARIQLSRRGRTLIEKMTPAYEEWRESLGSDMPARDLQALERGVNRLIAQLEEAP